MAQAEKVVDNLPVGSGGDETLPCSSTASLPESADYPSGDQIGMKSVSLLRSRTLTIPASWARGFALRFAESPMTEAACPGSRLPPLREGQGTIRGKAGGVAPQPPIGRPPAEQSVQDPDAADGNPN